MNIISPGFLTGLMGEFTFAGKDYKLKIKKVYTQVTNGRFQVDMEFEGEVPQGIRRGQTLQIRLALSDETQALLVTQRWVLSANRWQLDF